MRAVKPIQSKQWNGGYGADSGPSRGDPCRRAFRPKQALIEVPANIGKGGERTMDRHPDDNSSGHYRQAIAAALALGRAGFEAEVGAKGERIILLNARTVDRRR